MLSHMSMYDTRARAWHVARGSLCVELTRRAWLLLLAPGTVRSMGCSPRAATSSYMSRWGWLAAMCATRLLFDSAPAYLSSASQHFFPSRTQHTTTSGLPLWRAKKPRYESNWFCAFGMKSSRLGSQRE